MTDDGPAPPMSEAEADRRFAEWMRLNLDQAARHFDVDVTGEVTFGWRLRTIGAPVTGPAGDFWLRVVSEFPEWASGDTWTGNTDADQLTTVPRAQVIGVLEWNEAGWRTQRAELMELLPGRAVSATDDLSGDPSLPQSWWIDLATALAALRTTPTDRIGVDVDRTRDRTARVYGAPVTVDSWSTVHGDLHWANVFGPRLAILDWEMWGRGPTGYDEATLLLFSLRVPAIAQQVRARFADVLDSPAGRVALLVAAARLKDRLDAGDFPELAAPVTALVDELGVPFTIQR
ncbi:hypothetical protein ACIA49_38635 [Kribbella sp. NPDC051587]|uniref:hypothetical protein n=1 Tax=Kribbella sp. NPDC051587 TaxID=3364119 RepID=UPI0037948FF6